MHSSKAIQSCTLGNGATEVTSLHAFILYLLLLLMSFLFFLVNNLYDQEVDVKRIRKWFDEFAQKKGINPLVPENWKSVKTVELWRVTVRNK